MRVLLLAGLALAACTPEPSRNQPAPANQAEAAPAPPPAVGDALARIPNVEIQYYDVRGDSPFAIRQALNRVRPRDLNDGAGVDALSTWSIAANWPTGPDGGCDLSRTELGFTARLRLPRLVETPATPPAVLARWRTYLAALERHEATHIRNAWDNRHRVLAAIRASSCANALADARAAVARLKRFDLDYDQRTRHGATEGAHFP